MKKVLKNSFALQEAKQTSIAAMLCMVCMVCMVTSGCGYSNSAPENNGEAPHIDNEQVPLSGTAWKLVGIVGAKTANNPTGALRELRPNDCEDCYTLWFDTDYTATGINIGSRFKLDLRNLNPDDINMDEMMRCELYDKDGESYCDYDFFYRAILTTASWTATDDELKLFQFKSSATHLFFKRINRAPETLRGTQWHLDGIIDTQTGHITKPEPINALDQVIRFWGDYTIGFRSLESNPRKLLRLVLDNGSIVWRSYEDDLDSQFIAEALWSEIGNFHTGDNSLYQYGQIFAKFYELTQDELKLFFVYQENNYYLLYKLKYQ